MPERLCVGALIRDTDHRVYVHRRSPQRRMFPGVWDLVGGHVEDGESPPEALAREIAEETGWRLRRIEAVLSEWRWEHDGQERRELDYLVDVDGDLGAPVLEQGKHDAYAWVGCTDLDLLLAGRAAGDPGVRDVVAKGARTRLTERLRLEPIGPEHAADLWRLHQEPGGAQWWTGAPEHAGPWSRREADRAAADAAARWERDGVAPWIAYERDGGRPAGCGGLVRTAIEGRDEVELGWTVRPELQGPGLPSEIGRAALDVAVTVLGAERVVAVAAEHDDAARAVLECLGMGRRGEIRRGRVRPGRVYAVDGLTAR